MASAEAGIPATIIWTNHNSSPHLGVGLKLRSGLVARGAMPSKQGVLVALEAAELDLRRTAKLSLFR